MAAFGPKGDVQGGHTGQAAPVAQVAFQKKIRWIRWFYGEDLGLRVARKHLGWYMDEAGTPTALRREVLTAKTPAEVLRLLPAALQDQTQEDAA